VAFFSRSVLENLNKVHPEQCLHLAAMYANEKIYEQYLGTGGATLSATLCMSHRNDIYWVNLGDSRIYKYAAKYLHQLTVDDTVAGQLAREPNEYHGRNELLQFVGIGPVAEPHVGCDFDVSEPAVYLLSSDGVHFLPSKILNQINLHASEPAMAAKRMIELAMWCGGHDNASLIVGEFSPDILTTGSEIQHDCLEVWDAFGDARFFGVHDLLLNTQTKIGQSEIAKIEKIEMARNLQDAEASGAVEKKNIEKIVEYLPGTPALELKSQAADSKLGSRVSSKRKRQSKKVSDGTQRKEISDDTPPQLTIHFRRKE